MGKPHHLPCFHVCAMNMHYPANCVAARIYLYLGQPLSRSGCTNSPFDLYGLLNSGRSGPAVILCNCDVDWVLSNFLAATAKFKLADFARSRTLNNRS